MCAATTSPTSTPSTWWDPPRRNAPSTERSLFRPRRPPHPPRPPPAKRNLAPQYRISPDQKEDRPAVSDRGHTNNGKAAGGRAQQPDSDQPSYWVPLDQFQTPRCAT